jgi:hypothetical protein
MKFRDVLSGLLSLVPLSRDKGTRPTSLPPLHLPTSFFQPLYLLVLPPQLQVHPSQTHLRPLQRSFMLRLFCG